MEVDRAWKWTVHESPEDCSTQELWSLLIFPAETNSLPSEDVSNRYVWSFSLQLTNYVNNQVVHVNELHYLNYLWEHDKLG